VSDWPTEGLDFSGPISRTKSENPALGVRGFFGEAGIGTARFVDRSSLRKRFKREMRGGFSPMTLLARAINVECVGKKNADTEEGQQRCYDLDHRRTPPIGAQCVFGCGPDVDPAAWVVAR
jgi:hypothetical protein